VRDPTTDTELTFTGRVAFADEPDFEALRVDRVFNRRLPDRRPAAVVLAQTEQDVVNAVRLARARGWQVAVRSGGHSWAQWSVRDGALLIDLGGFKEIGYDDATGIVTVTGSVQGGDELDPFLAERGRFFTGGHCPSVGVGGFILQGGQGWNARGWGWAAERLVAIDVVTADGELVRADATQNADLLWAARGAGPGFVGVVTRFHLQTMPRPRHVAHTVQVYSLELFDPVMTWLHSTHAGIDRRVEIVAVSSTPPGGTEHVLAVTAVAFVDDDEQARTALAPFEQCPYLDRAIERRHAAPTPLSEHREQQRRDNPEGHRWRTDNAWIQGPPSQVVPAIRPAFTELPNAASFTIWFSMAPLRPLPDMAFSLQTEIYLASYVLWPDEADDEALLRWVEERMARLEPVTAGQYLGDSDLSVRQLKFMADDNWERLQQIRRQRDPEGVFVGYLAAGGGATNANHWEGPP
jgi:FAD/FMN-containing dehydrogenase